MAIKYYFLLIFGGLFTILSCQNDTVSSGKRPGIVQFVAKSDEAAADETGIDAIAEDDAIYLEWRQQEDSEIAKFEVYRAAEDEEAFQLIDTVEDTFYVDDALEINIRYYYYVLAVNYDQAKSASSDTIDYKLLEKPSRLSPNGSVQSRTPLFQWVDETQANDYIMRLMRSDNEVIIWSTIVPANFGSSFQQVQFDSDGTAADHELTAGVAYQWRIDIMGPENNCGAESAWTSFQIQ